jgi:hypothetical protein
LDKKSALALVRGDNASQSSIEDYLAVELRDAKIGGTMDIESAIEKVEDLMDDLCDDADVAETREFLTTLRDLASRRLEELGDVL